MEYLQPLKKSFEEHINADKAQWMKNYLRGQFEFYGLEAKLRRGILRDFYKTYGYPDSKDLFSVVFELWQYPQREYQHSAIELLQKFSKKLKASDINSIEQLIITKSWWDTVDGLATWICGSYFQLYPEQTEVVTDKWMRSGNFWLQRSCLLLQLKYKINTDTQS